MFSFIDPLRRILTEAAIGRPRPRRLGFGHSIGPLGRRRTRGQYDTLVIETRNVRGPRNFFLFPET